MPLNSAHYAILYPQNGDRIVATVNQAYDTMDLGTQLRRAAVVAARAPARALYSQTATCGDVVAARAIYQTVSHDQL